MAREHTRPLHQINEVRRLGFDLRRRKGEWAGHGLSGGRRQPPRWGPSGICSGNQTDKADYLSGATSTAVSV